MSQVFKTRTNLILYHFFPKDFKRFKMLFLRKTRNMEIMSKIAKCLRLNKPGVFKKAISQCVCVDC